MTTAGRIVFLRGRLGLSQKAFAELIGKSAVYMNKVENGKAEPTGKLLSAISGTFGVDTSWLERGEGSLTVESVGDRFRQARKARGYTQEELAAELQISRNSVGMIERGTFRPGEEIVNSLCSKLWIDRHWLLTGVGRMEQTELTEFYELLRRDLRVREHIRSFIDRLNHPHSKIQAEQERKDERQEDSWGTAYVVNDIPAARLFLEHYNIEYKEESDGKICVKAERDIDRERAHEVDQRLRKAGLSGMCDHRFIWRDREGNTLVTYSPYDVEETSLPWIEKVEENFYGFGTRTFLIRC